MPTVVNGQMSSGVLVSVGGGQALRADAAAAWLAVVAEVRDRFGIVLRLTDSYRPYAVQVRIFNERYDPASSGSGPFGDVRWWGGVRYVRMRGASAAVPGTSNHGWGVAVDVTGLGGFNGSTYAHLAAVAPAHGWSNKSGRKIDEAWHWEYTPAEDTKSKTPAPAQEDDMPQTLMVAWKTDGAQYVGDGITRRHLPTQQARDDLYGKCAETGILWREFPNVAELAWLGVDVATLTAPAVDVAALAAAIVKALPAGTTITAAQVADELARRLAS